MASCCFARSQRESSGANHGSPFSSRPQASKPETHPAVLAAPRPPPPRPLRRSCWWAGPPSPALRPPAPTPPRPRPLPPRCPRSAAAQPAPPLTLAPARPDSSMLVFTTEHASAGGSQCNIQNKPCWEAKVVHMYARLMPHCQAFDISVSRRAAKVRHHSKQMRLPLPSRR